MPFFDKEGLRIHYQEAGEGPPTLLIHGFASNAAVNWIATGWVDFLVNKRRRVIVFDHRGHGQSDKPLDPQAYLPQVMAGDALALLDYLSIRAADVMGYSMGARVSAVMALAAPQRVSSLVLAGIGSGLTEGMGDAAPIIAALEAPNLQDVPAGIGRTFRLFADQTGSNRTALAACMRATRVKLKPDSLRALTVPTLVAVGTKDEMAGSPEALAALIPGAQVLHIVDRDHMRAVGDKQYKEGVGKFWGA